MIANSQDVAFANRNGIEATPTVFINGRQTEVVAPEQLRTLIRELASGPKAVAQARRLSPR
jgi:protein-disulfide isomerase